MVHYSPRHGEVPEWSNGLVLKTRVLERGPWVRIPPSPQTKKYPPGYFLLQYPHMLKEFKEFAVKGNVIDLAVGVVIGTAFGKIVSSLVTDIIMPPLGILMGGVNFSSFALILKQATDTTAAVTLNYGLFLNNVLDFVIIAFAIFMVVKQMNRFKKKEEKKEEKKAAEKKEVVLLEEIRDLLKKK